MSVDSILFACVWIYCGLFSVTILVGFRLATKQTHFDVDDVLWVIGFLFSGPLGVPIMLVAIVKAILDRITKRRRDRSLTAVRSDNRIDRP